MLLDISELFVVELVPDGIARFVFVFDFAISCSNLGHNGWQGVIPMMHPMAIVLDLCVAVHPAFSFHCEAATAVSIAKLVGSIVHG